MSVQDSEGATTLGGEVFRGTQLYEIRVEGHLDSDWSSWFGGMEIALEEGGTSRLTGPVVDQSALHGLLAKLHNMGLKLVSVNRIGRCRDSALDGQNSRVGQA